MIKIDIQSRESLVAQICKALKQEIASGTLLPGDELPSARQLGGDLGIHWNTVSRAYRQLAENDIIFVARGRKAFVRKRATAPGGPTADQIEDVRRIFREGLTQARLYGMYKQVTELVFQNEILSWKT